MPAATNSCYISGPALSSGMPKDVPTLVDIIAITHGGTRREEIEIELRDEMDEAFTGTIAKQEATHGIDSDALDSGTSKILTESGSDTKGAALSHSN